jgi:hypothetical protein
MHRTACVPYPVSASTVRTFFDHRDKNLRCWQCRPLGLDMPEPPNYVCLSCSVTELLVGVVISQRIIIHRCPSTWFVQPEPCTRSDGSWSVHLRDIVFLAITFSSSICLSFQVLKLRWLALVSLDLVEKKDKNGAPI